MGATSIYQRDVLGRIVGRQQGFKDPLEPGNGLNVITAHHGYSLDSKDRKVASRQFALDGTGFLKASNSYNLASQRTSQTDLSGVETKEKTVMLEGGGRLALSSSPRSGYDNRHRITSRTYTADGHMIRQRTYAANEPFATVPDSGTLVSHQIHEKGRDAKGPYSQVIDIANLFDRRVTRTYFNERDQEVEIIHAFGSAKASSETFDYNDEGQLIRHVDPDGVTVRYTYNDEGERVLTAIDLDVDPSEAADHIDFEVDRMTRTKTEFVVSANGVDARRTTKEVFTETGPVITGITEQSLDGSYSATFQDGQRTTRQRVDGDQSGQWSPRVGSE